MGDALVDRGMRLVFGGGHVGMMGQIADRVLARGGEAFGVIPKALMRAEVAHEGLTELRVTEDMHERKALMAQQEARDCAMREQKLEEENRKEAPAPRAPQPPVVKSIVEMRYLGKK